MSIVVGPFEEEVKWLRNLVGNERYGYFDYNGEKPFRKVVRKHFTGARGVRKYGVYIVRCQKSNEVIYIGKGGTIEQDGCFRKQDMPKRLINKRYGNKSANVTFLEYYRNGGSLRIEYFILLDKELCPAIVEAFLLQAYLKEYGHLPKENKEL